MRSAKAQDYWKKVYIDFEKGKILSYGDRIFVSEVANYTNKNSLLSVKQCSKLKRIIEAAEEKGYVFPES